MTKRHPTTGVKAYLPYVEVVMIDDVPAEKTVTLGSNQTLANHFSAEEIAKAELLYFEPHEFDAWVFFGGSAPGTNDGHQIAQHEIREVAGNLLDNFRFTGSGAATITLLNYSGL